MFGIGLVEVAIFFVGLVVVVWAGVSIMRR
jgi:hypothetical protein